MSERLEDIYRAETANADFDNTKFWLTLETQHKEVADSLRKAIVESLTEYIFTDDWILTDFQKSSSLEVENVDPNTLFPLADLHFDYLTSDGKPTLRHFNCETCIIYDDNEFDCDFSESFDQ